jgi:hypothetical protein
VESSKKVSNRKQAGRQARPRSCSAMCVCELCLLGRSFCLLDPVIHSAPLSRSVHYTHGIETLKFSARLACQTIRTFVM